jgi:hypothetical protein
MKEAEACRRSDSKAAGLSVSQKPWQLNVTNHMREKKLGLKNNVGKSN